MDKTILHLDMNSYFATCEQQANPHLRGKCVGILKALGRGCVIAASIEAKKFGVKTGMDVREVKALCPQIILVPSDMDKYFSITKKLMNLVSSYSPDFEIFSIDELFLDITDSQKLFVGGAFEICMEIKSRLNTEIGDYLKCSIGIGFTKIVAKLASEMQKPDGLTFLTRDNYLINTEDMAVSEVCGIGYSRTNYLHNLGAFTLGQARKLVNLPKEIEDLVFLRLDEKLVVQKDLEPAKSVSRSFTTFKTEYIQENIEYLIRNLLEEACAKLREMGMWGRTFALSLSGEGGNFWCRKTTDDFVDDALIIYNILVDEYRKKPMLGARRVGVWISNLSSKMQCKMFFQRDNFLEAVDKVNDKHGLFSLYPASLLNRELVRPEVTGFLGDKWYRFGVGERTRTSTGRPTGS